MIIQFLIQGSNNSKRFMGIVDGGIIFHILILVVVIFNPCNPFPVRTYRTIQYQQISTQIFCCQNCIVQ